MYKFTVTCEDCKGVELPSKFEVPFKAEFDLDDHVTRWMECPYCRHRTDMRPAMIEALFKRWLGVLKCQELNS